jgi:hypothetical protein
MSDDSQPPSVPDIKIDDQLEPEDVIREGYTIQVSGGRTYVMPTTLQGEGLALAKTLKPDISAALKMPAGVRFIVSYNMNILLIFLLCFIHSHRFLTLDPIPSGHC